MRYLVFVLIALGTLPALAVAQGRPAGVQVASVTEESLSETVAVFGEVVSSRESRVAARVSGLADDVPIDVGDRVAEGDILARIDTELLEIGMAQAQAELGIAEAAIAAVEARLDRVEKAFRRAESLLSSSTISEAQLEDRAGAYAEALGQRQEALARIEAARTALRRAKYDLENALVRAPFDGVVVRVTTEEGQFIASGSEVATLVDTAALEIEANVPARYVGALQADQRVAARSDAGGVLDLQLRAILPTEFSETRTRPVLFEILSSEAQPATGQSVTLQVPISAPRLVTAVPKDALIQAGSGWRVFLAVDGKAQPRSVEIGAALGERFEVVSGLQPGDSVVVRGNERLRPGQDIAPMPSARQEGGSPPPARDGDETNGAGRSEPGANNQRASAARP